MQLMGDVDGAIEAYHQALSISADDSFSNEMLNRALRDDSSEIVPPPPMDPPSRNIAGNRLSFGSARGTNMKEQSMMSSSMAMDRSSRFSMGCSTSDIDTTMS